MSNNIVFSWAENAYGKLVHVDNVPNGDKCGCRCPYCKEKLLARHGNINEHGFAHHSDNRGANLQMCYEVTLYKLAEQIIQEYKSIKVPAYYGIFQKKEIYFKDVKIDHFYEREDKQPDIIATTLDGKQYLIEFIFKYKVQHKKPINYKNMNCLEIDFSKQSLDTISDFLLNSYDDRHWINNNTYFESIVPLYAKNNKKIRLVNIKECKECSVKNKCYAARYKNNQEIVEIKNNCESYRICKTEEYNTAIKAEESYDQWYKNLLKEERRREEENERRKRNNGY